MPNADVLTFNIAAFVAGLFLLEYGADKFIDHTAIVARRLSVSPTLVGLLTCGAEWEELVVVALALSQNNSGLALGNIVGSSIANILSSFSLGLVFINEAGFDRSSRIYSAVLVAVTSLFLVFLAAPRLVPRWLAGSLLVMAFAVYVASVATLIYRGTLTAPEGDSDGDSDSDSESGSGTDRGDSDSESDNLGGPSHPPPADAEQGRLLKTPTKPKHVGRRPKPMRHHILHLGLGLGALLVSGYVVAHSAATIGHELSLSGTVVGATILSLGTTLPEKFVAVLGGLRRQPGILVANTVGSNIFLATLCGGILFLFGDASQLDGASTVFEMLVVGLSAVVVLAIVLLGARRWVGGAMLACYVAFLALEFLSGRKVDND